MTRLEIAREQLIDQDNNKSDEFIMQNCPSAHRVGPGIDSETFRLYNEEPLTEDDQGCRGITCSECWNRSIDMAAN